MRITLKLDMKGVRVPYDYRRGIQAWIYSAMDHQTGILLHDGDPGTIKLFTFSNLRGRYMQNPQGLVFQDTASLTIASPSRHLLEQIMACIEETGAMDICGNHVRIVQHTVSRIPDLNGTITYQTMSPVTVYTTEEDGYHLYHSPEEKDYSARIAANLAHKLEQLTGETMDDYFRLYHVTDIARRTITYKGFRYTAYDFRCQIDTTPRMHKILQDCGIGARNAAGMGMLQPHW